MNKQNKIVICLLFAVVIALYFIQSFAVRANKARQAEYAQKQSNALTHDISAIMDYRSPYIGDASNVGGLFHALPLSNVDMRFEINSDTCSLTVNYLDSVQNIGEEKVRQDLIYNSVAAMAAIDNLTEIVYSFSDSSDSFTRKQIEDIFGAPLSELFEPERWHKEVQSRLSSAEFVNQFYE